MKSVQPNNYLMNSITSVNALFQKHVSTGWWRSEAVSFTNPRRKAWVESVAGSKHFPSHILWEKLVWRLGLGLPGGTALLGALSAQPGRASTFFLIFFRRLRCQKSRISRVSLPLALFHVYTLTDGHRCMFLFQISSTNTFLRHGRCMLGPTLDIRPSYDFWQ